MKYGISSEGVTALRTLATDMSSINSEIEASGSQLESTVSGLSDGLGVYGDQILDVIQSVNKEQEKGRDSVEKLTQKINALASQIESLVSAGI